MKPRMLVDVALLALLSVGNDTSSYGTSNLAAEYIHAFRGGDHHVGMLVLLAGL